jgi:hypothetical protein
MGKQAGYLANSLKLGNKLGNLGERSVPLIFSQECVVGLLVRGVYENLQCWVALGLCSGRV